MEITQAVGTNLHTLRTRAGVSLAELAAAGGISKTTLHGIEQGHGNPTLSTLWALATALKVTLGELLDPPASGIEVIRATDDRPTAQGDAVSARLLHRIRLHGTVEIFDISIGSTPQHSQAHLDGVEECLVITKGRVTVGPTDAPVEVAAGDAIRFDAATPHVYAGHTEDDRAILLMVHPD